MWREGQCPPLPQVPLPVPPALILTGNGQTPALTRRQSRGGAGRLAGQGSGCVGPGLSLPGAPQALRCPHRHPLRAVLGPARLSRGEDKSADGVAPRSRTSETCVRKLLGFCLVLFLNPRVTILEISTLRSRAPERAPTFLKGLGTSFPRREHRAPAGARPHRTRSAGARPTRGARAEPRLSRGRDSAGGWEAARERVPAGALRLPPGLAPRDPPGSWAAASGTMPGTPGLNCARIPGRCWRRRDPRSRPGGPPPPPLASSCSPYSPPLAPPVEPGGLSPQRRRQAAGLAGAELPGASGSSRLRALPVPAPRALDTPDPPDFGALCPPHPSSRPFLAFLLLPHPQTRGPSNLESQIPR